MHKQYIVYVLYLEYKNEGIKIMIIKFPLMKNLKVNLMCSIVFGLGFVMALGLSVAIGRPVYALLIVF